MGFGRKNPGWNFLQYTAGPFAQNPWTLWMAPLAPFLNAEGGFDAHCLGKWQEALEP